MKYPRMLVPYLKINILVWEKMKCFCGVKVRDKIYNSEGKEGRLQEMSEKTTFSTRVILFIVIACLSRIQCFLMRHTRVLEINKSFSFFYIIINNFLVIIWINSEIKKKMGWGNKLILRNKKYIKYNRLILLLNLWDQFVIRLNCSRINLIINYIF